MGSNSNGQAVGSFCTLSQMFVCIPLLENVLFQIKARHSRKQFACFQDLNSAQHNMMRLFVTYLLNALLTSACNRKNRKGCSHLYSQLTWFKLLLCLKETPAFWVCLIFSRFHLVQDLSLFRLLGYLSQISQFWRELFAIFLSLFIDYKLFDDSSAPLRCIFW